MSFPKETKMSNKTETKTTVEVPADVLEFAKGARPHLKARLSDSDKTIGIIEVEDNALYASSLPEGVTIAMAESIKKSDSLFAAGTVYGGGQEAIDFFKKHPEVQKVELTLPTVGKDSFSATFTREASFPNPQNPDQKTVKYCNVSAGFEVQSTRNIGDMKKVRLSLAEQAAAALAKG